MHALKKIYCKFLGDNSGAVAIIFGFVLLFALLAILSLSIDLNRTQTSYSKNQGATDAAALGVAELIQKGIVDRTGEAPNPFDFTPSQSEMENYAATIIRQNFEKEQSSAIFDPTSLIVKYAPGQLDPATGARNSNITVTACADLSTAIAAAAKQAESTRTCTTSTAAFSIASLDNLEVAFALDFTNSMYWAGDEAKCPLNTTNPESKCPDFANTKAKALVDTMDFVFDNYFRASPDSTIYGSIIPFTGLVNLYPYSKSLVVQNNKSTPLKAADIPHETDMTKLINFGNVKGSSYKRADTISNFYAEYKPDMGYVLDRIPVISKAADLENIVKASDTTDILPFPSYYSQIVGPDSLKAKGVPNRRRVNLCYNGAVLAALDQRIEQIEKGKGGVITTPDRNYVFDGLPWTLREYNRYNGKEDTGSNKDAELHESYPIQPLSNNPAILKKIVHRLTANTNLLNTVPTIPERTIDRQVNILNRAKSVTGGPATSSIHGLLWAWFTISDTWQGKWDEASLHELYYPEGTSSRQSRLNLKTARQEKLRSIILITDGHDNDGETNKLVCDAYTPTGRLSNTQYWALCDRIKSEGIRIHTLLLDFNEPSSQRYSRCSSPDSFYPDVKPDKLKSIMDQVFKGILTDLVTVRLTK